MRLSIAMWSILVLNLFVLAMSLAMGWTAQEAAENAVEERLTGQMVASVSEFLRNKPYPMTDSMMGYLREMFNAEWVVMQGDASNVIGSSLPENSKSLFRQQAAEAGTAGMISIDGQRYRFDSRPIAFQATPAQQNEDADAQQHRLFILVPYPQFQEARNVASRHVTRLVIPATLAATGLALLLAFGITHPIRRVTREMDRLATSGQNGDGPTDDLPDAGELRQRLLTGGPGEVRQLASSFCGLLDRLQNARNQLATQERLATLGRVCLSVVHELRNPLSGIKMNMRVLQDQLPAAAEDPGVEAVVHEVERMELYLNELTGISTGNSAYAVPVALAPTRLSRLNESVLTILNGRCRHAGVAVQRQYPDNEPDVAAEANQIRRVMMNIIVNGMEAMPSGGTLTIAIKPVADDIEYSVTDEGAGLRMSSENLFEPFSSAKPNGVGLGLYISKQIISRHGGEIGYEPGLQGGCRFWFRIPIRRKTARSESATNDGDGTKAGDIHGS